MTLPSQAPLDLSPRRREILDAAVKVLAAQGWRGLTHRAIDRSAGLPEGSSSAYYRSRGALQTAIADYVVWHLASDVEVLSTRLAERPGDHDHAIAVISATFTRWLDDADLLTARLELTLAAVRDDALAARLRHSRERLTGLVESIIEEGGYASPAAVAPTIVAALDGVLLSALPRPRSQRARFVTTSLDHLLGSLVDTGPH